VQSSEQILLSLILPEDSLKYFDIADCVRTDSDFLIRLEEKNNPPLEKRHKGQTVESKGFFPITISDFPIRGRKTTITFMRRKWQVGDEILKREMNLTAPGTKLEEEFSAFLKERG
jgi:hypothetical protein